MYLTSWFKQHATPVLPLFPTPHGNYMPPENSTRTLKQWGLIIEMNESNGREQQTEEVMASESRVSSKCQHTKGITPFCNSVSAFAKPLDSNS